MKELSLKKGFRIQGKPFKMDEVFLLETTKGVFVKCIAYGTETKTLNGIPCQLIKLLKQ